MNFVFIMTDTQDRDMVGAYGNAAVDTPNLDRLAETGIRFNRAYTSCPLCTPARGAIFTGLHPQVNGAWCNNIAPHSHVPVMGTIFRSHGYRAGYTGKWHLDGSAYFGDGTPAGGFEPDWWYDGKCYAADIGRDMFDKYRRCHTAERLREAGFCAENIWGHRVADRGIEFLESVGDEPFVLAVSFDEPHGPCVAPPEYWEKFSPGDIPRRANFNAPLDHKPALQQVQRRQIGEMLWDDVAAGHVKRFGCNSYIDREIGRVIDAVERTCGDDTMIIYTSDHGDIPLIIRAPGGPRGAVSDSVVSHVDILPTMLDLAGCDCPPSLQGVSLAPVLADPTARPRDLALINFHRFAINHDKFGEFYPIRCVTDGRYKLAVNLFETDEFYDLAEDPCEMTNRIDSAACADIRDRLHDALLAEMDRIRDPFRSFRWGDRAWRSVREAFYVTGTDRPSPQGFPFQPAALDW